MCKRVLIPLIRPSCLKFSGRLYLRLDFSTRAFLDFAHTQNTFRMFIWFEDIVMLLWDWGMSNASIAGKLSLMVVYCFVSDLPPLTYCADEHTCFLQYARELAAMLRYTVFVDQVWLPHPISIITDILSGEIFPSKKARNPTSAGSAHYRECCEGIIYPVPAQLLIFSDW